MNEILNLKHINKLLKKEQQTKRIENAQELLEFVIWKLERARYRIKYTGNKHTYLLGYEFEGIIDAETFIDSNYIGKEKKFYTIEEES
jgi:hypothetical protein